MYPLIHQTKSLHLHRKLKLLRINSIYLVFSSLEMLRGLTQTKVYYVFLTSLRKETTHKPSIVAAATILLSSVYVIGITCFDECFLFYVITGRHYFLQNVYRFSEGFSNDHAPVFFERSILKEVRILRYFHNSITLVIPKFKNKV